MTDWQPIETMPREPHRQFLTLQDGEVYQTRFTDDGRISWRTHALRCPESYERVEIEHRGQHVEARVYGPPQPEVFEHHWTLWTRGFDFKPTHWMPLPPPPRR